MNLEKGDKIFYQKNGVFHTDEIADILFTNEGCLYELEDNNFWCVTDNELLDESDERVRNYMSMTKDMIVKLSDVRNWLMHHAENYYEPDEWSEFNVDSMIKDLCKAMLYK